MCTNYDTAFADVKKTRDIVSREVVPEVERLGIVAKQLSHRADYIEGKLTTIEKHLPSMIEELIIHGLEKKVNQKLENLVEKSEMYKLLEEKMSIVVFKDYERR